MDSNNKICPACGTPATAEEKFCSSCGTSVETAAPVAPEAPVAASAPEAPAAPATPEVTATPEATAPTGYAAAPQQPAGQTYGQPAAPAQPYGQPVQPAQPYGGQPAYGTTPPPVSQPPKKSPAAAIIIAIVVVVAIVIGAVVLFGGNKGSGSSSNGGGTVTSQPAGGDVSQPATGTIEGAIPGNGINDNGEFIIEDYVPSLQWDGAISFREDGDDRYYSYNAVNNSDNTITYFECWAFFYDANGNPILDEYETNWIWDASEAYLRPGMSHTPESDGYWLMYMPEAEMMYVFVNYIEFSDGSWEGISDEQENFTTSEILFAINYVNEIADSWAAAQ